MGTMHRITSGKLEVVSGYTATKDSYDTIELLKSIKDCIFKFSSQKYGHQARHEALRKFYTTYQDKNSNSNEYYQRFKNQIEVVEHCGAEVGNHHPAAIEETLVENGKTTATATPEELAVARVMSRERYLACAFMLGADRKRYGKLVEDTENAHVQKDDKCGGRGRDQGVRQSRRYNCRRLLCVLQVFQVYCLGFLRAPTSISTSV
jgi:hypothetical protein